MFLITQRRLLTGFFLLFLPEFFPINSRPLAHNLRKHNRTSCAYCMRVRKTKPKNRSSPVPGFSSKTLICELICVNVVIVFSGLVPRRCGLHHNGKIAKRNSFLRIQCARNRLIDKMQDKLKIMFYIDCASGRDLAEYHVVRTLYISIKKSK